MSSITIQNLFSNLLKYEIASTKQLEEWTESIDYLGFNPETILKNFLGLAKQKSREPLADLTFLLIFGMTRGTKIRSSKVMTSMKEESAQKLKELAEAYNIVDGAPTDKKNTITIGRLIASASPIVAKLMKNEEIAKRTAYLLAPKVAEVKEDQVELPDHLKFPGSNSLYPEEQKMCAAYEVWAQDFSLFITSREKKKTEAQRDQIMAEAVRFAEITRSSSVVKILKVEPAVLKSLLEG